MDNPVLSICIVTYNRPDTLKAALESMVQQLTTPELRRQVEIVVSDDAGSSLTPGVVEPHKQDYNIVYKKNNPRLGFDLNIAAAVSAASGKYAWYFGDDDAIAQGALPFLVNYLSRNDIALITVDAAPYNNDKELASLLAKPPLFSESAFTYVYSPEEAYERAYTDGVTSSYIFLRRPWLEVLDRQNFAMHWLYLETILKMLPKAPVKKIGHLHVPSIYLGQECAFVAGGAELDILLSWKSVWNRLGQFGYDSKVYRREANILPKSLLLMVGRAKGHGLPYSLKLYKKMVRQFREYPGYLIFATVIYLMPNFTVRWARDIRKFFLPKAFSRLGRVENYQS